HDIIVSTTPLETLDDWFEGCEASLCACGHTHVTMLRRHRRMAIINPGSLGATSGFPEINRDPLQREFAIIDNADDEFQISFRSFRQDPDVLKDVVRTSGMPCAGEYLAMFGLV